MAIQVNFYKNFNKKQNSTLQPAATASHDTFTCNIKDGCSVSAPVLDVLSVRGNPAALGYNYAYIPSFKRYYFITEWRYILGVWQCSMHVDVLASFKTDIGSLRKYVLRSASAYDLDISDTRYPSKTEITQTIQAGNNPFTLMVNVDNVLQPCGFFILGLVGLRPSVNVPCIGGVNYYLLTGAEMVEFINFLMSDTFAGIIDDPTAGLTTGVAKAVVNPIDYIISCMYIPMRINGVSERVQPKIGWWNTSPLSNGCAAIGSGDTSAMVKAPTSLLSTFIVDHHPQYSRGHYLDLEPYSRYSFYLEPWGSINLDAALVSKYNTISYDIVVDLITGLGRLSILGNGSQILTNSFAQVGVPVQISQIMTDVIGGLKESAGTLGNVVSSTLMGNIGGAITSALSGIINTATAMMPQPSYTGANGSILSYSGTETAQGWNTKGCYFKTERFNLVNENLQEFGRPLCDTRLLSTLSGFIMCADADNNIAALETEKTEINSYLVGGFFYE